MITHIHHAWQKLCLLVVILTACATASVAQTPPAPRYATGEATLNHPQRVDIALVLAVDVSSSIESSERRFQREAYAEALKDPRVARMALGGEAGRVAIAYMEWSGKRYQRLHLPIRVMASAADLAEFADEILSIPDQANDPMYVQPTAVGDALLAAETAISGLAVPARNYIIDISGDGVLNDGFAINEARAHVQSLGLTVNALPIEVSGNPPSYHNAAAEHVAQFYLDCVIGGPGAFHLVARGFGDVRETLIMKLMLEMAQMHPEVKRRIAAAWNDAGIENTARILPAMMLELAPAPAEPRRNSNCGQMPRATILP